MSARHVILGLIREHPSHTYDIVVRFDDRLKPWAVNRGQVYRTVTALEREGLIEQTGEASVSAKAGPTYQLTADGAEELQRWFQIPQDEVEPLRGEILAKVAVAGPEEARGLLPLLDWYERAITQAIEDDISARRVDPQSDAGDWSQAIDTIVADAALLHRDAELQWIRRARVFLAEFAERQWSDVRTQSSYKSLHSVQRSA